MHLQFVVEIPQRQLHRARILQIKYGYPPNIEDGQHLQPSCVVFCTDETRILVNVWLI